MHLLLLLAFACADRPAGGGDAVAEPKATADDTAVDCGSPFEHDSGVEGGNHGSPENTPYEEADFDLVTNCQSCHPDQYDEWHGSIHAYSAINPVMWKGSESIGKTTSSPLVCIGCHAPVATLLGIPNEVMASVDQLPAISRAGVNCVSCHKLYDLVNGVNQFTHCEDYYFGTVEDPEPSTYHQSEYSPIHTQAEVCRSCHNVQNLNRLQVEYTYTEWQEANAAAGGAEDDPAIQTCQDCHMPAYTGRAAVDGPERTVHRHTFVGADVALQPFPDSHRQYREVQALMRTAAALTVEPVDDGGFAGVDVSVTNLVEGHDLPSGSAFDRQVWVELTIVDADGQLLLESGALDANGDLQDWNSELAPGADPWITDRLSIFRSYLADAYGEETFDFIGAARTIEDDSLAAGETRWIRYDLPTGATLPVAVEARLLYRPFPPFLLREHGFDDTLVGSDPIFEMATASLVVE